MSLVIFWIYGSCLWEKVWLSLITCWSRLWSVNPHLNPSLLFNQSLTTSVTTEYAQWKLNSFPLHLPAECSSDKYTLYIFDQSCSFVIENIFMCYLYAALCSTFCSQTLHDCETHFILEVGLSIDNTTSPGQ